MHHTKRSNKGDKTDLLIGIFLGGFIGFMFLLLFIASISFFIQNGSLDDAQSPAIILLLSAFSTIIASAFAYKINRTQRMLTCVGTSIVLLLILLAVSALFYSGKYNNIAVHCAVILSSGCLTGFAGLISRKRKYY